MKMKSMLILLLLLAFSINTKASTVTIKLLERQGPPGSYVRIPVSFSGAMGLAGLEGVLQFDSNFLNFIEIKTTNAASGFSVASKVNGNQIAIIMASGTGFQNANGTLLELVFRIRQTVQIGAATDIFWRDIALYDDTTEPVEHTAVDGVIKVSAFSVFPNPFTPGQKDGFNDFVTFVVPDSISYDVEVKIFSVSGNKVRELSGNQTSLLQWHGLNDDGKLLRPGVYPYVILHNNKDIYQGTITLMR